MRVRPSSWEGHPRFRAMLNCDTESGIVSSLRWSLDSSPAAHKRLKQTAHMYPS